MVVFITHFFSEVPEEGIQVDGYHSLSNYLFIFLIQEKVSPFLVISFSMNQISLLDNAIICPKSSCPKEEKHLLFVFLLTLLRSLHAQVAMKVFSLLDLVYLFILHGNKCDRKS